MRSIRSKLKDFKCPEGFVSRIRDLPYCFHACFRWNLLLGWSILTRFTPHLSLGLARQVNGVGYRRSSLPSNRGDDVLLFIVGLIYALLFLSRIYPVGYCWFILCLAVLILHLFCWILLVYFMSCRSYPAFIPSVVISFIYRHPSIRYYIYFFTLMPGASLTPNP
jgi:hypothetical protein